MVFEQGGGSVGTDIIVWRNKTYVKGTGGVAAWYYATSTVALPSAVYDLNGTQLASTSISVQAGVNDISFQLNDWLTANDSLFSEGIYILKVGGFTTPFIVAAGGVSIDVVDGMYPTYVRVIDLDTGISVYQHPREYFVPLNTNRLKWLVLQYYYDPRRGMGRLKTPSAETYVRIDTGWARLAGIRISFRFASLNDLVRFLSRSISVDNMSTLDTIGRLIATNPSQALSLLKPFGYVPLLGGMVMSVDIDPVTSTLSIDELVPLGFFDVDRSTIQKVALMAVGAGLVIAGAIVSGPLALIATGAGVTALILSSLWPSGEKSPAKEEVEGRVNRGIQQVENATKDALTTLDTLYSQGQVTDTAYKELKTKIEEIYSTAISALSDIKNIINDYYQQGYDKGYRDARTTWGLAGALAGYIARELLGRRGMV